MIRSFLGLAESARRAPTGPRRPAIVNSAIYADYRLTVSGCQAIPIVLNEIERERLERLKRGRRVSVRLAERAAIVLHAADGLDNQEIGEAMGVSRQKA